MKVMIDFLKMLVVNCDLIKKFESDSRLFWFSEKEQLSHFTDGIILRIKTKSYNGINFLFFENKLEIHFKPHYYYNEGKHNANDFTVQNCINVISEFIKTFRIQECTSEF